MPAAASEPIRKTTLNLFEADIAAMEKLYGRGWTEQVRNLVRAHIHHRNESLKEMEHEFQPDRPTQEGR